MVCVVYSVASVKQEMNIYYTRAAPMLINEKVKIRNLFYFLFVFEQIKLSVKHVAQGPYLAVNFKTDTCTYIHVHVMYYTMLQHIPGLLLNKLIDYFGA